jgi:sulfite exporter TauE/SafE
MMMGFMPCGMVLAALMLASTTGSAALAATGMALFALATVPVLQLTGSGLARLGRLRPAFAGRGMMAANGLFLCALGASLITVS